MNASESTLKQLDMIFSLSKEEENILREKILDEAEKFTLNAVSEFENKYMQDRVNPLIGTVYCNYLYWLSRLAYENNRTTLADKIYALNRMLHSVDLFYAIKLPSKWFCEHPIGSVMGRAVYSDYFFFYQGCTVGGTKKDGKIVYPIIGKNVLMYSNSKIIGKCTIGDNVTFSANSYVINQDIPSNCLVFGQSPNIVIKEK